MLEYFGEYSWDLSMSMALDMGANMDELDRASRRLRSELTTSADPAVSFFEAYVAAGDKLVAAAQVDEASGHHLSASEKYRRASIMYVTGERMPMHDHPARESAYDRMLSAFDKHVALGAINCARAAVPYENSFLPSLLVRAPVEKAPAMVLFNGLDGTKEFLFHSGFAQALAARGVSTLIVDNPGVGEALRRHGLRNFPEAEKPAGACIDFLEGLQEIDRDRIGMVALSMGGYHAPRAVAFESRFKCCVAWGGNYDFGSRLRGRIAGSGAQKSVPHMVEHVKWVLGAGSVEEACRIADGFTLKGVLANIRVPILITHGEKDRQVPVEAAYRTYEECVNSPERQLRIFSEAEGGEQHCSIGNMSLATDYMADWIADTL